ncbi:CHAT domain-containing protein [Scytonema tolypothrichoides VB-61278]|nr:CHAT domain-containing protein [Scytonema tolypothrichoides VB-61278]
MSDDNYLEKSEVIINNFRGQNLRGKSFQGKNLSWVNFSRADIRGANFSGATLIGADFRGAQAGLQDSSKVLLVILLFFLSALSGFISTLTVFWIAWQLTYEKSRLFTSIVFFLIVLAVFLIANTSKGLLSAIGILPISVAVTTPVAGVLLKAGSGHPTAAWAGAGIAAIAVVGAVFVAMAVTGTRVVATTRVAAVTVAVAVAGAVIATVVGRAAGTPDPLSPLASRELMKVEVGVIMAVVAAISLTLLSIYIAVRVFANDKKYTFIQGFATAFAAIGGTSFRGADLTEADFTRARLKSTNFQRANITRTRWSKVCDLEWAKVNGTILTNSIVRELLVSGKGNYESFMGLNLQGANLAEAELVNANFTKAVLSDATFARATLINADFTQADLSRATFVKANLQSANLSKTLALGTIFCEAKLTAACIESWTIDDTTLLEESFCDYVYLKDNKKERYPSSGKFAPGDFEKLFQEVINTVDLIFHNGINQEAFIDSWHKIQVENEGIKLDIQGIERKGDNIVVVRVNVPATANKSKIYAEFMENYEMLSGTLEAKYQALLDSKEEETARERQDKERLYKIIDSILDPFPNISARNKVVVLKLGEGDFSTGFPVTLQIGEEKTSPSVECSGKLPSDLHIPQYYNKWQSAYRKSFIAAFRLDVPETQITNVSNSHFYVECCEAAESLKKHFNLWLSSEQFRPVKEQMLVELNPADSIRFILQTENELLRRLPWHLWDFFERYSKAEVAMSNTAYQQPSNDKIKQFTSSKSEVRILAILGYSCGIDVQKDQVLLKQFTEDAEVIYLIEPTRKEIQEQLWNQAWDILYFAGHSSSSADAKIGHIRINETEKLTISDLRYALENTIQRGLRLSIFNSCDGLGLAFNLANLHIPQMIVMREFVPDEVAQEFLTNFLKAFVGGKSLYQSVRDARKQLQHWENWFPCTTWLPVIFQNPAQVPPFWQELRDSTAG